MLSILGAGRHSSVVADAAYLSGYSDLQFFDDLHNKNNSDDPPSCQLTSGSIDDFFEHYSPDYSEAFVAIGNSVARYSLLVRLLDVGFSVPSLIHPSAFVSDSSSLLPGCLVAPLAVVNNQATLGLGCIVNTLSSVDHHCTLQDCVHVCPGVHLAGSVSVGAFSTIGIGSSIINNVFLGSHVTVGAGSVVLRDLPDGVTAYGSPARIHTR